MIETSPKSHPSYLVALLLLVLFFGPLGKAKALNPGDVTISMTTAPFYTVDSNDGCSKTPNAAYIGFEVTNVSGATLTDLYVKLGNFTNVSNGLAGGQDSIQYIGTLTNGSSDVVYWYTLYDCDKNNIPSCSDMTVTVNDANAGTVTAVQNMCTRSSISANAGGLLLSQTVYGSNIVGGVVSMDVQFEFGGVAVGDEYNIQPAGNLTFDAACFQLINCKVIATSVTAIPLNTTDDLYYVASAKQTGSGHDCTIRFFYKSLCVGASSESHSYASQTSGATNMKHTSNIGDGTNPAILLSVPASLDSFEVKKIFHKAIAVPGDTVTCTVTVFNLSADTTSIDKITDSLPSPFTYVTLTGGSEVTTVNTSSLPDLGDDGDLEFISGGTSAIFPYPEFVLEAGDSIKLIFTVAIPLNALGSYQNKATVTTGTYTTPSGFANIYVGSDADGDGIADRIDLDSDNDGIPDYQEVCGPTATSFSCMPGGFDPSGDEDNDGIPNYMDAADVNFTATCTDAGADGICDTPDTSIDNDGDGIPDYLDLDSDNDGIPDLVEAGGTDTDGDGKTDQTTDTDGDGLADIWDNDDADGPDVSGCTQEVNCSLGGSTSYLNDPDDNGAPTIIDSDGDLIPNYLDLDSDNDGIPDLVEAGGTDTDGDGTIDSYSDTDSDGFSDVVDGDVGNDGIAENTAQALLVTGADIDSDGLPDSYLSDDIDGDNIPSYLDLDSDNDGITDVVEAGGTDTDGDGIADGFADTDSDGFNDIVDGDVGNDGTAENAANALQLTGADGNSDGVPDSYPNDDHDGDGILNQYDLDADGDGILDVTEAGGVDANRDGIADGFTDTDQDGLNDSLDGDVGNDGTAENAAAALVNTGADANSDGKPDNYSEGDSDSDNVPDFLDVDSDNDGIFDIYEAQSTSGYIPPSGVDDDGDGIDNVYDDDDVNFGGAGAAGLVPVNTDSGTGDTIPDYLDTDSDGDEVPDMQEAWDHLADGDSQPDGVSGSCTSDADGDGLVDCFDSDDSNANIWTIGFNPPSDDGVGGSGSTASTGVDITNASELDDVFPSNSFAGADNSQPDFRDIANSKCSTSQVVYGMTDPGTVYEWNGALHSNAVDTDVVRATAMCLKTGGWHRFYNPLEPDNYLFSIQNNTNTEPLENVIDYIEITVNAAGPVSNYNVNEGMVLMRRSWNVVTKGSLNGTVNVRFYYEPGEYTVLQDSATALATRIGGSVNYRWFKISSGVDYANIPNRFSGYSGDNFVNLNSMGGTTSAGSTDGTVSDEGNAKNYVQFDGLSSFSGGTFGSESSNVFPVEFLSFTCSWLDSRQADAVLTWETGAEINNDYFLVERTEDGIYWKEIGKVNGKNNNSQGASYSFIDEGVAHQMTGTKVAYRLKQVDFDGTYLFSKRIELTMATHLHDVQVWPNPFHDIIHFSALDKSTVDRIYITDLHGRRVFQQNMNETNGPGIVHDIETSGLLPGLYYLTILFTSENEKRFKLMKRPY